MAGFLTCFSLSAFPLINSTVTFRMLKDLSKLTAAGTVQDLHLIPSLNFTNEIHHHLIDGKNNIFLNK